MTDAARQIELQRLRRVFEQLEAQLLSSLNQSRATFDNPSNRGDEAEDAARAFLRQHLPRRLSVGQGEVIDLIGGRSRQVDVVVANEEQPFTFAEHERGLFFVEGVVAAGEVKSLLNSGELTRILQAGTTFKTLRNTHSKGATIWTNPSDRERFYACPPFFALAFETNLAWQTLVARLQQAEPDPVPGEATAGSHPEGGLQLSPVDAVFVLGRGAAINFGDGHGALQFRTPSGESVTGWVWRASTTVLADLLLWLSAVMPRIQRPDPVVVPYLMEALAAGDPPST